MNYTEQDLMLEIEAALATHHPHEEWIRRVAAKYVWGSRANKVLIGLLDGCERVAILWYHKRRLTAGQVDPEASSGVRGGGAERFDLGREDVPAFIAERRDRFVWIHPDWRRLPYPEPCSRPT